MAHVTNPPNNQSFTSTCRVLQLNLLGLKRRLPELQLLISLYNPAAIALQEPMVPESKVNPNLIKGYDLYTCENPNNPTKTGIGMALRTEIPHHRIDIPFDELSLAIVVEIDFPTKITLLFVFISPATHHLNQ